MAGHDKYIGVDPGASGAIAVLDSNGAVLRVIRSDWTEHDVADELRDEVPHGTSCVAVIEKVAAMPKQGVSSTFKFGQSYGFLRGLLVALEIPFMEVSPSKWQGAMNCRTAGNKNISKSAAQRRWPGEKITHRNADALLIAEFCRTTAR